MITLFGKKKKKEKEKEKEKEIKKDKKDKKELKEIKEIKEIKKETRVIAPGKSDIAWRSLKQPLISEKATFLEEQGKYIFKVLERTNKREIKKAIEDIYRAKVDKVNIMNT
ncbi:MAG: 50S ribosomal protein L23, partial [Candidatus Pacebacteria bacterium]|nr:50S ribosomal protein L23 [Candidatus Paceibacterota bacterium]